MTNRKLCIVSAFFVNNLNLEVFREFFFIAILSKELLLADVVRTDHH